VEALEREQSYKQEIAELERKLSSAESTLADVEARQRELVALKVTGHGWDPIAGVVLAVVVAVARAMIMKKKEEEKQVASPCRLIASIPENLMYYLRMKWMSLDRQPRDCIRQR